MIAAADRVQVWRNFGATEAEADELAAYAHMAIHDGPAPTPTSWPAAEAASVDTWKCYVDEAAREGAAATLRRRLVQLQFPIALGISESPAYRAATRRGALVEDRERRPFPFIRPERLRLFLHPTIVGRVPVIVTGHRSDFESLVRALTERNEPVPIPSSMGACIVAGYNNWDRIAIYRRQWAAAGGDNSDAAWAAEFSRLVARKDLYQDRFILLSSGPYSAVSAAALGVRARIWRDLSVRIRLEHECAHLFMREAFGAMRNALLDELVADFAGMVAATGEFHAAWFVQFMGLDSYPSYCERGRLTNYRGALSAGAFRVLQAVAHRAAGKVETFHRLHGRGNSTAERACQMASLAWVGLEGIASDDGVALLLDALATIAGHLPDASCAQNVMTPREIACERRHGSSQ